MSCTVECGSGINETISQFVIKQRCITVVCNQYEVEMVTYSFSVCVCEHTLKALVKLIRI